MAERTAYQNAVAAGIAEAGHVVEWRGDTLFVDGQYCGSRLAGEKPAVESVPDAITFISAWRARRLSGDSAKAIPVLLDRLISVLHQKQRAAKHQAQVRRNDAMEQALLAAIGEVPGLRLIVSTSGVEVTLTMPALTPEGATRLGVALREIVGT